MNKQIGKRIKHLIYIKGFTSLRKFSEYLEVTPGLVHIHEDTIERIINGKNMETGTLSNIAQGLGLSTECLMSPYMPFADGRLDLEYEYLMDIPLKERKTFSINDLRWFKSMHDVSKRVYPDDLGDIYNDYNFKITTLAEFTIYYPLCDKENILEVIDRISGAVDGYENYILEQYRWLYETIPDSPAKRYADYQATVQRLQNKKALNPEEEQYVKKMMDYEQSEEYLTGKKQYKDLIKKKRDVR